MAPRVSVAHGDLGALLGLSLLRFLCFCFIDIAKMTFNVKNGQFQHSLTSVHSPSTPVSLLINTNTAVFSQYL